MLSGQQIFRTAVFLLSSPAVNKDFFLPKTVCKILYYYRVPWVSAARLYMRSDDRRNQIVVIIIIIIIIVVRLDKLPSDGFHIVLRPRSLTYTHYNNKSIWRISPYRTAAPPAICETLTRHNRGELSPPGWGKSSRRLCYIARWSFCTRRRVQGGMIYIYI